MKRLSFTSWELVFVSCLFVPVLSACHRSQASSDVPVSIHAVNYSDQEIQYYLQDPTNESNSGGGEAINRFAAGGIICCYSLPKKWQPGNKVKVVYEVVFPAKNGGKIETKKEVAMLDIPEYVAPEELWLVREVEGKMSIVLSNFEPGHPNWPGKVKGWPVPSLAYQRERWSLYFDHEISGIKLFQDMKKKLDADPIGEAKKIWPDEIKYKPELKANFSGPDDPGFVKYLREDYDRGIERSRAIMRKLEESKP